MLGIWNRARWTAEPGAVIFLSGSEAARKRREIAQNAQKCAHKKEPVRIARTPRNATKCNTKKTANRERTKKNQQFCNTNTGAGWMRLEFLDTIRARQIGAACCPVGEFIDTITRACPAAGTNLFTRICAGEKSDISDTLKRICEHESAREASFIF